jgi:AcrR family transcriptional regulator
MPRLTHVTERGRETLYALREALFALILEKGFDYVTIKDITDRAQIDRSTFYLHCRDKRDLLLQSQQQLIADFFEHYTVDLPLEDRLRQGFAHVAAHATAYRALLAHADSAADNQLETFLATAIASALEQGPLHVEVVGATRDLLAHAMANVIRGVAQGWLAMDDPPPPEEVAHFVQQFLVHGLAAFTPEANNR